MPTPRTARRRPVRRLALALAALLSVAPASPSLAVAPADGGRWAPADRATITPGVQMYTAGGQCTGNFVFTDRRRRVYVGYAAHCAGTGEATDTDGCRAGSLPLGTRVRFARGGSAVTEGTTVGSGRLVYSSWLTMRRLGTDDPDACAYNDFALVRVGPAHVRKVNPSVPFWGGPVGLRRTRPAEGETVHSFGSSSLRGGLEPLSPKQGLALSSSGGGWSHLVLTLTPGVPGDSGSGFLDAEGRAVGTLSTLTIAPLAGSNGVGDLHRELAFARRHAGIPGLRLVRGTEEFSPIL
ncbi:MAG: hypothetical protein ACOYX5_15240 [Actinomycetota bacterium]